MYSQAAANELFETLKQAKSAKQSFTKSLISTPELIYQTLRYQIAWNAMLLNFREESLTVHRFQIQIEI